MRLRRLDILGFKSFANKSTFLLDGKITVLAGPNGSGKSNVAEAVRWVLGEQKPSALRSRRADEVIFLGSATRAPTGMAEVSLTLDNSDGRLPLDFGEVRVSRRIYRSGESEYLLNGRRVRLRDITDTLLHVGLGPDTYTVIGQGAVDEMIAQRPEERRAALESAADVRRHQIQLAETRSRLNTTEENLQRCLDVLAELEPQVRRMRSYADRAGRAREVQVELRRVSRAWYRHQLRLVVQCRDQAEGQLASAARAVESHEADVQKEEQAWRVVQQDSESLGQRLTAAELQIRERRHTRDRLQRQVYEAREEELRLATEAQALAERGERLAAERQRSDETDASLRERLESAEHARSDAQEQLASAEQDERTRVERVADARRALSAASAQITEMRTTLDIERRQRESGVQQLAKLRETHAQALETLVRLDLATSQTQVSVAAAADRLAAVQLELERCEHSLTQTEAHLGEIDTAHQGAHSALRETEQEMARLEAARTSLEESMKRMLADAAGTVLTKVERGVLGVLGPSLEVRPGMERVVSAALGERVSHAVVDGVAAARDASRRLQEGDDRAVLALAEFNDRAVLESVQLFRRSAESLLATTRWAGFVADQVETEERLRSVCLRYLGHSVIVPDLDAAVEAARRFGNDRVAALPWQVVTLAGEVIRWNGEWRTGADRRQVRMVASRTDLASLERQLEERHVTLETRRGEVTELELAAQQARERRGQLRDEAQRTRQRLNGSATELDQARRQLARVQQERAATVAEHGGADGQIRLIKEGLAATASRAEELELALIEAQPRLLEAEAAFHECESDLAASRAHAAEARGAVAQAGAEAEAVRIELRRLEQVRGEIDERLVGLHSAGVGLAERQRALAENVAVLRRDLDLAEAVLPRDEAQLADLLLAMNQLASRRGEQDARLNEARRHLRQAETVRDAAALDVERARSDQVRLETEIADELDDLDESEGVQITLGLLADGQADEDLPVLDPVEIQRQMRSLKRELARIGPVDDAAMAEYQELIDRYEFLTQQTGDLESASTSLQRAMAELEALIQSGLDQTLTAVNEAFQHTFERLFNGGEARLVWSAPDNPLTSGIDIVAQPPGKRLQPLSNFSGGERALASVALVFALLQVNPTPFCVLDEVDAALDETNVGRFADILRERADRTQFIVVTHNRNTMEIADALFGVSMDRHGVSRIVSLRLEEVEAAV